MAEQTTTPSAGTATISGGSWWPWIKNELIPKGAFLLGIAGQSYGEQSYYAQRADTALFNAANMAMNVQQIHAEEADTLLNMSLQFLQNEALLQRQGRAIIGSNKAYYGSHGVEIAGSALFTLMDNVNELERQKKNLWHDYLNRYTAVSRKFEYAAAAARAKKKYYKRLARYQNRARWASVVGSAISAGGAAYSRYGGSSGGGAGGGSSTT